MTIQEALKANRPFRRKIWPKNLGFVTVDEFRVFVWESLRSPVTKQLKNFTMMPSDIVATDWESKK